MTPARFEQRLDWLKRHRFVVLGLGEAIDRLRSGKLRHREIAITIDDGFHSVYKLALPLLRSYDISATVYVTSYYVTHPNPVFRLAIQYMAWKSPHEFVDRSGLVPDQSGRISLHGPHAAASLEAFYESAETNCTETERASIAREFGRRAAVDYDALRHSRKLSLMSGEEIKALRDHGYRHPASYASSPPSTRGCRDRARNCRQSDSTRASDQGPIGASMLSQRRVGRGPVAGVIRNGRPQRDHVHSRLQLQKHTAPWIAAVSRRERNLDR